jgi:L-ascorbate metabolism protein UlaG (beta-lactamase superfamily)
MRIRRLGWAGIEITAAGSKLVVDYVRDAPLLTASLPQGALVVSDPPADVDVALVTHLHADHSEAAAIASVLAPGGVVLRPAAFVGSAEEAIWTAEQEAALSFSGLDVRTVADWDRVVLGPFSVTAVPAVDGLGDPQVNWVIEAEGKRVFHGGDTMFHGYWWLIARRAGPVDVAVLPINGAVVNFPHLQPASPLPAVLTPEQAAHAAAILGANTLVPVHFGLNQPPFYVEPDELLARLASAAEALDVRVNALRPGEGLAA